MIAWYWLIPAALAGGTIGLLIAALCRAAAEADKQIESTLMDIDPAYYFDRPSPCLSCQNFSEPGCTHECKRLQKWRKT